MNETLISKIIFTITFPGVCDSHRHVSGIKLHSLARSQLSDLDIIETIDHLFSCQRCFETYRHVRSSCQPPLLPVPE